MKDINQQILNKWLSDPSFINWAKNQSQTDVVKWEEYLNLHTELWETAKAAKLIIQGIPFNQIESNKNEAKQSLKSLLSQLDPVSPQTDTRPSIKKTFKTKDKSFISYFLYVATAFLIGYLVYTELIYNPDIIIQTAYGEQKDIHLSDGSIVNLNANSTLHYKYKYPRKIRLEGEAFFEVTNKKDSEEIFEVLTNDITVKVYGTSFNVNSRNELTNIYLEEGEVELETEDSKNQVIRMEPGDLIKYSSSEQKLKAHQKNVSKVEYISWKDGTLIFKDVLLTKALYDIEDIYGIQFVLQFQKLHEEKITGGVPIGDLNITLETLSTIYGLVISNEGKRYFLTDRDVQ